MKTRTRSKFITFLVVATVGGHTGLNTADAQMTGPAPSTSATQSGPPLTGYKMTLEPAAMALLKATCARLAAAKTMSFTATISYEFPSKLGPPIVYTVRNDVTMQRPDRLKVITPGDGPATDFYYNGKAIMAYSPAEDLVAESAAPPTIDDTLRMAYETSAIYYPFTDLVLADPYHAMTDGTLLAFKIGDSDEVGGVKTIMVAWADKNLFLQIWIGADDKLPRRIRAIYRNDPLQLRHDMVLSNWKINPDLPPGTFESTKATAAKKIPFGSPVSDERPDGTPLFIAPVAPAGKAMQPQTKP
jgi:hypothetical protein